MSVMAFVLALADPVTVTRGPDPGPPQGVFALAPLVGLVLLFFAYRLFRRRRRPSGLPEVGFMSRLGGGTGMGNALAEMNAILDPSRPVIMMMESDCQRDADYVGDGRGPKPGG